VKPAAVITGLGGMGKTALAAEVLALWEAHFQWVLLYQGKLSPLGFDATLRDIHIKLMGELGRYHDHVRVNPADAISREPNVGFAGPERLERLTRNLIRAMKDEPILLVLDNFETNLKQQAEPRSGGDLTAESRNLVWACQDSEWDYCLAILAKELIGSQSRVLVTCRRPIAALADGVAHQVLLGPLPPAEAAFFLKEHPALSRMVFAADHAEKDIALRLLNASRFHPLLMDRLARLAEDVNMRSQLITLIEGLEAKNSFAKLSSLFDASPGDAKELAYLNEALASSLDQIILNTNPDARKLLWMIGVADATVARDILEAAWYHLVWNRVLHDSATSSPLEDYKDRQGDLLSSLVKKRIKELLSQISSVGLVSEQCFAPGHASSVFSCHEIVRERICIWMDQHSDEKGTLSEEDVWLAYAEQLELDFQSLHAQNVESALRVGNQAITYLVRAGAWAKLGDFANTVITCTRDPHLLENLIPFMQTSAESAPQGASRWRCIHSLANILRNIGRPDCSLPLYEQAARLARNNLGAENSESQRTWEDISKISSGWAISLRRAGHIEDARQRYIESIEACQKANRPIIHCLSHELEILRLDIIAGKAATAAPEVEERLVKMRDWWKRHLAGESLTEAPDADFLARALIGALDVATEVASDMKDMESAIRRTEETLEIRYILKHSEMEIAIDRFNLAKKLTHIPSRYGEARMELEDCLRIFKSRPDWTAKVLCCLADLFGRQGDITEAITQQRRALAICQGLPDPSDCGHSHDSLASFLKRLNIPSAASEAKFHQLAAMIYFLVASIERRLQASLNDYRDDFCHAHTDGTVLAVPKVADVLADTSFHTLRQWLIQRQVDMDELQSTVDHLLDLVRQEALSQP
jgi:tetratricopeptide (TPR) repeat protein